MTCLFRVEAHDGNGWRFGIRINDNTGFPEFCGLTFAEHFFTRAEALKLKADASRLCGGTLRVARIDD